MSGLLERLIERYLLEVGPYGPGKPPRWRVALRFDRGCPVFSGFGISYGDTLQEAVLLRLRRTLERCEDDLNSNHTCASTEIVAWIARLRADVATLTEHLRPKRKEAASER